MERQESCSPGSRLMSFFQSLDRILSQKNGAKTTQEDVQQIRYLSSKILQHVSSSQESNKTKKEDKIHRDIIAKNVGYIDLLLTVLATSRDGCTTQNIVYILSEVVGKTNTGKRASCLVAQGASHVLLQLIVYESKESQVSEELLFSVHQVLSKIGPKDRKFGVKARLSGALSVTLNLVKNLTNLKILHPVVHVLKLYAINSVNASYLGKNGAISHLFKLLALSNRKYVTLSKYALDTMVQLVKSKSNSARAIGQGGVPLLLTMYADWHRVDTKNRHVNIRKAILSTLKHITNLRSGRRALMEADGVSLLYSFCQEVADSRELETLVFMASIIMRKCFPRNRLPLVSLRSVVGFSLPQSEFHVVDAGEGQDEELSSSECVIRICPTQPPADENGGYESSVDNDDDVSSEEDIDARRAESDDENENENSKLPPCERSSDDLNMYAEFFSEQSEFNSILEEEASYGIEDTIILPSTFEYSSLDTRCSGLRSSQSANSLLKKPSNRSLSPLIRISDGQRLTESISDLKIVGSSSSFDDGKELRRPNLNSNPKRRSEGDLRPLMAPNALRSAEKVEISPKSTKKPLHSKNSPKAKRRGSKTKSVKEKREKKPRSGNHPVVHKIISEDYDSLADENSEEDAGEDMEGNDPPPSPAAPVVNAAEYAKIAALTRSVGRFNKIAYPELKGSASPPFKEAFYEKRFGTQRQKIFEDIDRFINPEKPLDRVVYDLDSIVSTAGSTYTSAYSTHSNDDEERVRNRSYCEHLGFNSQFESGNLRKAIQVRQYEYDLILNPDVNTNHHHQWFYFEVSQMEAGVRYRFNIVNCEKVNSQFNFGMRPVVYSVVEAMNGRPHWLRSGSEICYYKNHFVRSSQTTGGVRGKVYFTGTFTMTFKHERDVCYIAYHYPYPYTTMMYHLQDVEKNYDSSQIFYKRQKLTQTLAGNDVPVLTITSHPHTYDKKGIQQLKNRAYIYLSSRVHPGESNASWVMRGTINFLMSDKPSAQALRDMYIFKIVPMLNPDGVINGNHRCSLTAEDLNRRWLHPCPHLHPTIFHSKGLLQYLNLINRSPLVFCDYHGHSRRKNVFLYGCSPSLSWMTNDFNNPAVVGNRMEDQGYKTLPKILQTLAPAFSFSNCNFVVEKSKESTARVVVWRECGVMRSYTMESTYCGCDQGNYKGYHINTRQHEEMGRRFCEALARVRSRHYQKPLLPLTITADLLTSTGSDTQEPPVLTENSSTKDDEQEETEIPVVEEGATCVESVMVEPLALQSNTSSSADNEEEDEEEVEEEEEEVEEELNEEFLSN